jgi:hypothetical protein
VKRAIYIGGIALFVSLGFVAATWGMLELLGRNVLFINVRNYSHKYLENIVVSGSHFSDRQGGMGTPGNWDFSTSSRLSLNVRVAFDVDGQHYDVPGHAWLIPFGETTVTILIGERLNLMLEARRTDLLRIRKP